MAHGSAITLFRRMPIPSTSISTTSPGTTGPTRPYLWIDATYLVELLAGVSPITLQPS
jgi:hypothetical protein